MPPSGIFLLPSGRIICGTGRQAHSTPATTKITFICFQGQRIALSVTGSEMAPSTGSWQFFWPIFFSCSFVTWRMKHKEVSSHWQIYLPTETVCWKLWSWWRPFHILVVEKNSQEVRNIWRSRQEKKMTNRFNRNRPQNAASCINSLVTNRRSFSAIRHEVVATCEWQELYTAETGWRTKWSISGNNWRHPLM